MPKLHFKFPCGITRREALWQAGNGFFGTALAYFLAQDGFASKAFGATSAAAASRSLLSPTSPRSSHFPAKAKSCIFLYMTGGPSHLDTFDPKPELVKRHGQQYTFPNASGALSQKSGGQLKGAPWKFNRCGQSGIEISEILPRLSECADDLAVIRSTVSDSAAHGSASLQMNTGMIRQGFPSLGAWATYGLGTLNQNMPGFVVLVNGAPYSGALNWSCGFMPAAYQGTVFNTTGDPILNLKSSGGSSVEEQRRQINLISKWNETHRAAEPDNSELAARIANYELAFRMQASAPDAVNLAEESAATRTLYGMDNSKTEKFGRSCLMARRLVERGVRFVELFHSNWDTHGDNDNKHKSLCNEIDRPIAGLIQDLKQRGLLDETLIVWAGEFGRTPIGTGGRDHHAAGFSTWMAGGGIRGGTVHGATDELGYSVVEGKTHVHDLHATILHLMGIDHRALTYFHAGRDYRLTDVAGQVVKSILA
jgi:hypothetical protein